MKLNGTPSALLHWAQYAFYLLLVFSQLLIPGIGYSQAGLSIIPNDVEVLVGETFTVTVAITLPGGQPADGVDTYLDFDPTVLEVTDLEPITANFPVVLAPASFDNSTGSINYSAGTFGNFPTESFDLLNIDFRALVPVSASQISFSVNSPRESVVASAGQNILTGPVINGMVTVQNEAIDCDEEVFYDQEVLTSPFVLRASSRIVLEPGFSVPGGVEFTARIEDCQSSLTVEIPTEHPATLAFENDEVNGGAPSINMAIRPNPSHAHVEICIQSKELSSQPVTLSLFNSVGRVVKRVATPAAFVSDGVFCQELNTAQLAAGIYYVQVSAGLNRLTEKLMVTH